MRYEDLNARGRERLDQLIRELSQQPRPHCEACAKRVGSGRWREQHPGRAMPLRAATCVVWVPDRRVMVDLSRLALSCDEHVDFYPYPETVDFGSGPRRNEHGHVHIVRQVVWPQPSGS